MTKKKNKAKTKHRRDALKLFAAAGASIGLQHIQPPGLSAAAMTSAPEKANNEITNWDAITLSKRIHARDVSCQEVMHAYLGQIEHLNPTFNAIVSLRPTETLLKEAKKKDDLLAKGHSDGWMHGFPHAVKDLSDVQGMITTKGSPLFKQSVAQKDSLITQRMRSEGAIFIGKTNVPEFGLGSQSYNPVFGVTRCAYDKTKTAGGSSGGSATAIALHMVPCADGSDMMGSLRNPAAFNNIIGFRPSVGVVPGDSNSLTQLPTNGPMGRNVADTAHLLATLAGSHKNDPSSLPIDPAVFTTSLQRDFKKTRVGWLGDFDGYLATEDGLLELCQNGLSAFEDMGCEVDNATIDFSMPELWQTWLVLRQWHVSGLLHPLYSNPKQRALLKPEVIWEIENGLGRSGQEVFNAGMAQARWLIAMNKAFETHDFLVLPTAQVFPFDAETHWPKQINGREMDTYHRWMEVVIPGSLMGCPVINVPVGFSKDGRPMGLQIMAPKGHDHKLLQFAYAYEQAVPHLMNTRPQL